MKEVCDFSFLVFCCVKPTKIGAEPKRFMIEKRAQKVSKNKLIFSYKITFLKIYEWLDFN